MLHRIAGVLVIAATLALPACDGRGGDGSSGGATSRDSAGVRIVENAGNPWTTEPRWRLASEPHLRIGTVAGDSAFQFDGITGVLELGDQRIVVANGGTNTLRWFAPDGKFLFSRGGKGEGPGEFSRLWGITNIGGDTIAAIDASAVRLSLFSGDGSLASTFQIAGLPNSPSVAQRLASGAWIVGGTGVSSMQVEHVRKTSIVRVTSPLLRFRGNGAGMDTFAIFPGAEVSMTFRSENSYSFRPASLGRSTSYAVRDDEVIVGTRAFLGVDAYAPDGKLIFSMRSPDVNLLMTDSIAAEYRNFLRRRLPELPAESRPGVEREIAEWPLPPTIPPYGRMLIDVDGNVWLGEYRYDNAPSRKYLVYDRGGRFMTTVVFPERLTPFSITRDRVWGRAADSLDVQYVESYTIRR